VYNINESKSLKNKCWAETISMQCKNQLGWILLQVSRIYH
jgi:hypothetical protein